MGGNRGISWVEELASRMKYSPSLWVCQFLTELYIGGKALHGGA